MTGTADGVDGSWEPDAAPSVLPDSSQLQHLAAIGQQDDPDLGVLLDAAAQQQVAHSVGLSLASWSEGCAGLDSPQLIGLVRFYTLAEASIPGCDGGDSSPVIAMARELRTRGDWPEDLRAWIRSHSNNRFLPWGNLLHRL